MHHQTAHSIAPMETTLTPSETVMLVPGLVVSLDALRLLWALEDRGCTVQADGGNLLVGPRHLLTEAERARVRQHKPELLALVQHVEAIQ